MRTLVNDVPKVDDSDALRDDSAPRVNVEGLKGFRKLPVVTSSVTEYYVKHANPSPGIIEHPGRDSKLSLLCGWLRSPLHLLRDITNLVLGVLNNVRDNLLGVFGNVL